MNPTEKSQEALVGAVLEGLYRIDGVVGQGGMGAVYAATHLRLGKRVAVKVMAREFAVNSEALARFHREAQVTSGLGHPHIVQVFDFSVADDGSPFIVMEFLEGEDLDHRLRRIGHLGAKEVVHVVKQVASALTATHGRDIVHRDLKPGNIYLLEVAGETDFVKVLDFGISKIRSGTLRLTRAAEIIGTPSYMSPEQALGRVDEVDERTDQWALACIAWECLTGRCLFAGESAQAILFQVVHLPTPRLLTRPADFSPAIENVLRKALSKDKAGRFATVNAFALALEEAAGVGYQPTLQRDPTPQPATASSDDAMAAPLATPVPSRLDLDGEPLDRHPPSTLSHTAGQLDDMLAEVSSRGKWLWIGGGAIAGALLLGGFLLYRRPPDAGPVVPASTQSVVSASAAIPSAPALPEIPDSAPVAAPLPPAPPPPAPASAPAVAEPEEEPPTRPSTRAGARRLTGRAELEKPRIPRRKAVPRPPKPNLVPSEGSMDHNYTDL
jgi:serine/threonine protein kinase